MRDQPTYHLNDPTGAVWRLPWAHARSATPRRELGRQRGDADLGHPQGRSRRTRRRSGSTLSAKPCMVVPAATRTPIAAILRSGRCSRRPRAIPRTGRGPARGQAELGAAARSAPPRAGVRSRRRRPARAAGRSDSRPADPAVPGDLAAAVDLDHRACRRAGVRAVRCASPRCRPSVCSSMITVSGRMPAETSAWIRRCWSQACGIVDRAATEQVEHVESHGRGVYVAGWTRG